MAGFGAEDNHFVVELTYNYGIKKYELGNDFQGLTVFSSDAVKRFKNDANSPLDDMGNGTYKTHSPDGYTFYLVDENKKQDPVDKISLGVSNLETSMKYWHELLGMKLYKQQSDRVLLGYGDDQCKLELVSLAGQVVDHATGFGRIAFSCPRDELPEIQAKVKEAGHVIITPLVRLDTPGKAAVEVIILADVDGHEICFVGDEAFRDLSQVDPTAKNLLEEAMDRDKSDEWFAKRETK
ncbi:glyoxalase domain-containing protein 4-like isoform X2 [Dendronephthya gigantea]|nr:glyoxalase domain-containing protein 4-like isoform X2 [Dendronephthya gigantea]XP_028415240.1 glyoxalase domain-containing protein 4-like isoform X2 [Dendronephthya gigantea]